MSLIALPHPAPSPPTFRKLEQRALRRAARTVTLLSLCDAMVLPALATQQGGQGRKAQGDALPVSLLLAGYVALLPGTPLPTRFAGASLQRRPRHHKRLHRRKAMGIGLFWLVDGVCVVVGLIPTLRARWPRGTPPTERTPPRLELVAPPLPMSAAVRGGGV